jgi:hypothetical protein
VPGDAAIEKDAGEDEEKRHPETVKDHVGIDQGIRDGDIAALDTDECVAVDHEDDGDSTEIIDPGQSAFFEYGCIECFGEPCLLRLYIRLVIHVVI